MAKATTTKTRAKPEASAASTSATKMLDESMEQFSGFAGMFGEYAENGLKAMSERASGATEIMRSLGDRNMEFFTKTLEQGVEATQAITAAKDVREVMEIQAGFAKSMFSAYTKEMNAQAEICMSAWRDAAKPFMAFAAK
ncbi:MAG: phasin family protein [Hyphomonas sp.]|nr:phasin family protein [Hyphomonas sp.]MCB9962697.1 phasin family protein [Hyphomonas sp.]MCB9970003.1 phasin family protein [Hyphomonas sp.]